jgi:sucrose-6-phosphate hydrolase SacC (GH32 family)
MVLTTLTAAASEGKVFISTSFHEPATDGLRFIYSRDGWQWQAIDGIWLRPEVGKQRVMRDPSMIRTPDGTFHLVWTSSWRGDRGFGYASSKDLVHWTEQRFIEVMTDTTTVNVWAPELFWDDAKRQAVIMWASCIPGKFPDGQEDHKNNHRLYYATTKDFKHFAPAKLMIEPGFSSIDGTLVKRGHKDYVMVL